MAVLSTQWSWNSARLIALVLNALYGLEEYYDSHHRELDVDGVFGLRIIQGHLIGIEEVLRGRDVDEEIVNEIRNISRLAAATADKALAFVAKRDSRYFIEFRHLILRPYMVKFILQRTDEKLRWKEKQLKASRIADTYPYPGTLFAEKESDRCFAELLSADYSFGEKNLSCKISDECMERMVGHRGLTGYQLTHQILYVAVAQQTPCVFIISHFLLAAYNQTIGNFLSEYCTNLIDELSIFMRNPKLIARLSSNGRDLLMEQIFTCGQFGFVEVSSLHLLASILSWQNPILGCFIKAKTFNLVDTAPTGQGFAGFQSSFSRRMLSDVVHSDLCSTHSATVAAGALVVFLRFLLDRGPWSELYLADQPVIVHSIAAEDKFRQYRYGRWVRDSFISSMQHTLPPHIGWSPDMLAYLLLLCIILGGSVTMHFCYKPKVKQFYHFSYKKL